MKARKLLACLMAGVLTISAAACGTEAATDGDTAAATQEPTAEASAETAASAVSAETGYVYDDAASITFADGSYTFLGSDTSVNPAAKETVFELTEHDGHSAVRVTSAEAAKLYAGIQLDELLGNRIGDVASVEIGLATETGSSFVATSGNIYAFIGGDQQGTPWSIYMENKNPKTIEAEISGAAEGDYLVLTLESTGTDDFTDAAMVIDTISFKDASGNVLPVDTSVAWIGGGNGGEDRSNLYALTGAAEVGTAAANGAWSQTDVVTIDEDIASKLVPGAVLEISYTSMTGNLWIVMNGAEAGWMRVGVGDADGSGQGYSYINGAKNIAQVTYEQIAEYCGEDVSTWGGTIQAESDGDWEVYSVKLGQAAPHYALIGAVEVGQGASGDGWGQADIISDITAEDVAAALVPGSVLEISYTSETGELWIVMNGAEAGWMRVGVGDADGSGQGYAVYDGSKCYIPYELIAEYCGDDISTWGTTIQAEASSKWEVFGVRIGQAAEFAPLNQIVTLDNAASNGAWSQSDILDLTDEAVAAALVPGSVVSISYTSESGELWVVMNGAEAGWMRVGVGDFDGSGQGYAIYDGSVCQIPYELIAEYCGDDVSTWGPTMQAEASTNWEVYSVSIGQAQ